MPNRVIREDIITSENVNKLSWLGQVFFYRLLLSIDNAARFDARPEIIRSFLFPLDSQKVSVSDVAKLLSECEGAGLVRTYEVGGKMFLVVKNFGQNLKYDTKSKYPPPPLEEKRREVEVSYTRPRDFLLKTNEIEFQSMQANSRLNGGFEKCIEQWSLSVEGESGDKAFNYTGDNDKDYRVLKAKAQKWINSWNQNKNKFNTPDKGDGIYKSKAI